MSLAGASRVSWTVGDLGSSPGYETTSWGPVGHSSPLCLRRGLSEMAMEVPPSPGNSMISWLLGAAQAEPGSGVWGGTGSTVLVSPKTLACHFPLPVDQQAWGTQGGGSARLSALCRNHFHSWPQSPCLGL